MKKSGTVLKKLFISDDTVLEQLRKILISSPFIDSAILRKFLSFIVSETISGRSDFLKEYNIGVSVLNKPKTFNPNETVIVRVHAMRLRNALTEYYENQGLKDSCVISIPKGGYIPTFGFAETIRPNSELILKSLNVVHPNRKTRVAVMPFKTMINDSSALPFAESMAMTIGSALVKFNNLSILSYYTSKQLSANNITIQNLSTNFGINFLVTGSIYFDGSQSKISIQLIEAETDSQIWVQDYYFDLETANVLELGNMLVVRIMDELTTLSEESSAYMNERRPMEITSAFIGNKFSKKNNLGQKSYRLSAVSKAANIPQTKKAIPLLKMSQA
jgi:TolB-like protein